MSIIIIILCDHPLFDQDTIKVKHSYAREKSLVLHRLFVFTFRLVSFIFLIYFTLLQPSPATVGLFIMFTVILELRSIFHYKV